MPTTKKTATTELSPRAAAIAAHDKAGFTGREYTGRSKTRNSATNAKPLNLTGANNGARADADFTTRMRSTLTDLARAYGTKPFPILGIDRGQAAIFVNSGTFINVADDHSRASLAPSVAKQYGPQAAKR